MRSPMIIVGLLSVCVATFAETTSKINLEEPVDGGVSVGISNVRGWAVSTDGIEKIELYVDGQFVAEIPYGGQRGDVEAAYPQIPNALNSGFGQTFNYGLLGAGEHTLTARAITNSGEIIEDTNDFTAVALPEPYYRDDERPDFSQATASIDQETGIVSILDVSLNSGETMNLEIRWATPVQDFTITGAWEGCTANLLNELDPELIVPSSRNVSVVQIDGVVQEGSEFELTLTNESQEELYLISLNVFDDSGDLYYARSPDFEEYGYIPANSVYSLSYVVGSGRVAREAS